MSPYIRPEDRKWVDENLTPSNVGELTYHLTDVVLSYLGDEPNFAAFADILGALEATKLELYRRSIGPYEDAKRNQNGEISYPYAR